MRLGPKARHLLDLLFMTGIDVLEVAANPKRVLFDTVGWSSDRNFNRHLKELGEEGWVSWKDNHSEGSWVIAITESGKNALLENIDPEESWSHQWDKKWRTLSFDLPQGARRERRQLDAWLRKRRFGHLQGSVWISHRPYSDWTLEIEQLKIDPRAVLFQESVPLGTNKDSDYVESSWDFDQINALYESYISSLGSTPTKTLQNGAAVSNWFREDSTLWKTAFDLDPFLPEELLPSSYLGKTAWKARRKAYKQLGRRFATEANPTHQ